MSFDVDKYDTDITQIRTYALVGHMNEIKMACKIKDEWIIDSTCSQVNSLMKRKVISVDTMKDWLTTDILDEKQIN
jgi:hypothetical protein